MVVGITFDYNIELENREYKIGEIVNSHGKEYVVRALGKSFIVCLVPKFENQEEGE